MNRSFLVLTLLGVAALAGLFVWLRPATAPAAPLPPLPPVLAESTPAAVSPAPEIPADAAALPVPEEPAVEVVVIEQGRRVSGPEQLQLRQGDTVRIAFLADAADELHLHGYDLTLQLKPGEPATLEFVAHHSGRFEYELHGAHQVIGALEVLPR